MIVIRDTGIGIPPDKLERIFDEYYQVDTHGTKRLGVGLGLAIVKEVARLLNFRVKITSTFGRSTEVTVVVPPAQLAEAEPEPLPVEQPIVDAVTPRRTRVFLVEDNDSVRMATELFLKLEGFEVPTLCLTGDEDVVCAPEAVEALARRLARGRFVCVPATGHSVYFERPVEFNRLVDQFLATLDGPR